jgi:hypothetical protein
MTAGQYEEQTLLSLGERCRSGRQRRKDRGGPSASAEGIECAAAWEG